MDKGMLQTECIARKGNKVFFSSISRNIVYKCDLHTGKTSIIGIVPGEDYFSKRLFGGIEVWKESLYFIPLNAKKLWIYNTELKKWNSIDIRNADKSNNELKFFASCIYKNKLYMFGFRYPAIIIIDLETECVVYDEDSLKKVTVCSQKKHDGIFRTNYVKKSNYIYLASCVSNQVFKYNLEEYKGRWYDIGESSDRFSGIVFDGEYYWLSPRMNSKVIKWDGKCKIENYYLKNDDKGDGRVHNLGIAIDENRNIVIPSLDDTLSYIKTKDEEYFEKKIENKYLLFRNTGKELIYTNLAGEIVICSDEINKKLDFKIAAGELKKINYPRIRLSDRIVHENEEIYLNEFIQFM